VASAYINEFIGAEKRGRFFLLHEVIFPIGLMFAGMASFWSRSTGGRPCSWSAGSSAISLVAGFARPGAGC